MEWILIRIIFYGLVPAKAKRNLNHNIDFNELQTLTSNSANDAFSLPAYEAVANYLMNKK